MDDDVLGGGVRGGLARLEIAEVLDIDVPLARHRDADEARDLRLRPEFIGLRDEIAAAIQPS